MSHHGPKGEEESHMAPGAVREAFWRSVEEFDDAKGTADTPEAEKPEDRFPWLTGPVDRRQFFRLVESALAASGLSGCSLQEPEKIVAHVKEPEERVPGTPVHYATSLVQGGAARGVLVENHEGRPTKVEGNPEHPASLGGADIYMQASVLTLYDPDRSKTITHGDSTRTWSELTRTANRILEPLKKNEKKGSLRILTGSLSSPTLESQITALQQAVPGTRWHRWDPLPEDNALTGSELAFGSRLLPRYDFRRTERIATFQANIFTEEAGSLAYAKSYGDKRAVTGAGKSQKTMPRLYALESSPSVTGTLADHALPLAPDKIEAALVALAERLGVSLTDRIEVESEFSQHERHFLEVLADDLRGHKGKSLVAAGRSLSPEAHAVAHAINAVLQNAGKTVSYGPPWTFGAGSQPEPLDELVKDMHEGQVDMLLVYGTNPAYTAPADLEFEKALAKVGMSLHMGLFKNETGEVCDWHVPAHHEFESWSDARAYDGTASLIQPVIRPLYASRSLHELLEVLRGGQSRHPREIVREVWTPRLPEPTEASWRAALQTGFIRNTSFTLEAPEVTENLSMPPAVKTRSKQDDAKEPKKFVASFQPDPTIWDGSYANNPWLQETPNPVNTLTWENAVLLSPKDCHELGIKTGDFVRVSAADAKLEGPALPTPRQAAGTAVLTLGYGRKRSGRVGDTRGYDAYQLRTRSSLWTRRDVRIHKVEGHHPLATTQNHHKMEERHPVQHFPLDELQNHPEKVKHHLRKHDPKQDETLYPIPSKKGAEPQWGMSIDLNRCIGCNACITACQSENNIPSVGRDEVSRGREMHWIRVDRYYKGPLENPEIYNQPVLCMHCEYAPCEAVCPVEATLHSDSGLNQMIYNRCVGTRYCSNNCPYKVRRFNFLGYAEEQEPEKKLQFNPNVSVRETGVMEKCTYCVQRINKARIEVRTQEREIEDGVVVTACQQTCPTNAIVFGDISDPNSHVSQLKNEPTDYSLLADLNTRPRTTYMARLHNRHPRLNTSHSQKEEEPS